MISFTLIIFNLILFFSLTKIAKFINIYDNPDGKLKIHKHSVPVLGGILFFLNFWVLIFLQLFFFDIFLIFEKSSFLRREIISLLFFITFFFTIGLFDDKYEINPYIKLTLIIFSSILVLLVNDNLIVKNFVLSFYENKIFLNNFSIFFTIFCIVILINALNFYDGINGQSGIFYIFVFSFLYYVSDNYFYLIYVSLIFFNLLLNLTNKLFFGDSGIYLIGSILIICLIYEHNFTRNIIYADEIFFLFLLPGFDLVRLTFERLISNKNMFYGDRKHFHHYLNMKYDLFISNLVLMVFNSFPIVLFKYGLNFYYILFFFISSYFLALHYLKKFSKKGY